MAKNTTATGSTIDGVTVVHPDNMGNTLVFKDKVYNVNVGDTLTVGEDGLVDVKLSADKGNLLEARDDGLYYGVVPEVGSYYVSNTTGSNANSGTRQQPFKTLEPVLKKLKAGQHVAIFLDENDTHEWRSSWGTFNGLNFTMLSYGEVFNHVKNEATAFTSNNYRSAELKRPTLVLIADRLNSGKTDPNISYETLDALRFYGIKLQMRLGENMMAGGQFFGGTASKFNLHFIGCELTPIENQVMIRVGHDNSVIMDHCKLTNTQFPLIHIEQNGLLNYGLRSIRSTEIVKGERMVGNKADGSPTTLTYNGSNPRADFLTVLSGKTVSQEIGVIY